MFPARTALRHLAVREAGLPPAVARPGIRGERGTGLRRTGKGSNSEDEERDANDSELPSSVRHPAVPAPGDRVFEQVAPTPQLASTASPGDRRGGGEDDEREGVGFALGLSRGSITAVEGQQRFAGIPPVVADRDDGEPFRGEGVEADARRGKRARRMKRVRGQGVDDLFRRAPVRTRQHHGTGELHPWSQVLPEPEPGALEHEISAEPARRPHTPPR